MNVTKNTDPRISVIVPALNEAQALPVVLDQLLAEQALYECIVVDGGSNDGTREVVLEHRDKRVKLLDSPAGRGAQMNLGARAASGDVLLFHHADTLLTRVAFAELVNTCRDSRVLWGGYQHQFSQSNWKLRLVSWLHNFRFRCSGVVYGDQSMFARRDFFHQLGGFSTQVLEDLEFSDRALNVQASTPLLSHVVTDSRKFRQMGELRALAHVLIILVRYQLDRRTANETFFEPYR